jgi:hypothetical protein
MSLLHVRAGLLDMRLAGSSAGKADTKGAALAERISAAAWEGTIGGLSATWPALRQLLLAGTVQRLCEPELAAAASSPGGAAAATGEDRPAAGGEEGSIKRMQELGLWVSRLLGVREKSGKQGKAGAKRKGMAGAEDEAGAGGWRPGPEQARELLGSCLRALAGSAGGSSAASAMRMSALQSAAALLLRHCGGGERLQQLLELATAGSSMQLHADAASSAEALVDIEGSMAAQREALAGAEASNAKLLQGRRAPEGTAAPAGPDR